MKYWDEIEKKCTSFALKNQWYMDKENITIGELTERGYNSNLGIEEYLNTLEL